MGLIPANSNSLFKGAYFRMSQTHESGKRPNYYNHPRSLGVIKGQKSKIGVTIGIFQNRIFKIGFV